MELWIKSQDKECLMKVDRLDYDLSSGVHQIKVNGYQTLVGKYKSKERALEVLNEIQKAILFSGASYEEMKDLKEGITGFISTNMKSYATIYEMPEQ